MIKKNIVIVTLSTLVITGVAAMGGGRKHYSNLKVLPKNISQKDLSHIMIDEVEDGLGVGCGFCHAKEPGSNKLDYVSDAKPEKKIARSMMRMTMAINKKFFNLHHLSLADSSLVVTCGTCHRGEPRPDESSMNQ